MTINPPNFTGQNWGYQFESAPTASDSDYDNYTLAYTSDGTLYLLIDNTPANAIWVKFIPSSMY